MQEFYARKYSLPASEYPVTHDQIACLEEKHAGAPVEPISAGEVTEALNGVKTSTASGLVSVCYSAIKAYHSHDTAGKLVAFYNDVLQGHIPIPRDWLMGKICCLIPKFRRPSRVQDMRPISHTPCLGKLFSKILIRRLRGTLPPYKAGQHANRPGTQALEAVASAQATMRLYKQATGEQALVCKLDISQAFDTLSHQALWRFIKDVPPMSQGTSILLQLGSTSWSQELARGLLQGTSFSADIFSRVLDHFLAPLLQTWKVAEHETFRRFQLPHALLFADDLLLFATSTVEMQNKLRSLQQTLAMLGLRLNLAKCSVLNSEEGTTPAVWAQGSATPLQGTDHLTYLGVPLCYRSSTLGQLGVSLAKTSSAFSGPRRLFDHPDTPVQEKLQLFQAYITSKWA